MVEQAQPTPALEATSAPDLERLIRETEENLARLKAAMPPGQAKAVATPTEAELVNRKPTAPGVYGGPHLVWAASVLLNADNKQTTHEQWLRGNFKTIVRAGLPLPRFDKPPTDKVWAFACVLQNCWIAKCPWCRGEEGIWSPDDWFYCMSCGNEPTKGQRIAIGFAQPPENVASVLELRGDPTTRGWLPTETINALLEENATHQVPVPAFLPVPDPTVTLPGNRSAVINEER